jgi:hypothetical protein
LHALRHARSPRAGIAVEPEAAHPRELRAGNAGNAAESRPLREAFFTPERAVHATLLTDLVADLPERVHRQVGLVALVSLTVNFCTI